MHVKRQLNQIISDWLWIECYLYDTVDHVRHMAGINTWIIIESSSPMTLFHKMTPLPLTSFYIDSIVIITAPMEKKHHRQIMSMAVCAAPFPGTALIMWTHVWRGDLHLHIKETITSCQAFRCYCPLNYYYLLPLWRLSALFSPWYNMSCSKTKHELRSEIFTSFFFPPLVS